MANYDIIGNIALVKFSREDSLTKKKKIAQTLMKQHPNVRTVLEKSDKIKGRLRTPKTKFILGEKTKEALYKENNCVFRLNVDTCYFSPRLASERAEIAKKARKGESILIMFGGVAPYAIVIAKLSKAKDVVSIELGKDPSKYALENVKRNKLQDKVKIIQGDVGKVLPQIKEKFSRIVMARPNLKEPFLDVTFPKIKKSGIIHYYGFYEENKKHELINLINREAKKAKKKIKILNLKRAGEIGFKKFRWRVDLKIVN